MPIIPESLILIGITDTISLLFTVYDPDSDPLGIVINIVSDLIEASLCVVY